MSRTQDVLNKVHAYRALYNQFDKFCALAEKQLAEVRNEFGIDVKASGDDVNSRELIVLNNRCRMRFGVRAGSGRMLGKLIFERMISKDTARRMFTVYFDSLGNATETPADNSWPYSLTVPSNTYEWVAVRVLEEFFKDLADEDASQDVAMVKLSGI